MFRLIKTFIDRPYDTSGADLCGGPGRAPVWRQRPWPTRPGKKNTPTPVFGTTRIPPSLQPRLTHPPWPPPQATAPAWTAPWLRSH